MSRSKRPRLSEDDLSIWRKVARSARPIGPAATRVRPASNAAMPARGADPAEKPPAPVDSASARLPAFRIGAAPRYDHSKGHDLAPTLEARLAAEPVRMDSKAFRKLKRGKLSPERKIDLHGMTLAQAHPALTRFILKAHSDGLRLVVVVTGKGTGPGKRRSDDGPIPTPRGVLRHQVPGWLQAPPLAGVTLQVTEAHVSHGGSGAYYVYLARRR